jgi:hypothetical protein
MHLTTAISRFMAGAIVVLVATTPAMAQDAQGAGGSTAQAGPAKGHPQTREGFWFNAGLGIGSLGCQECEGRTNGLSGGLSLGGTISPHVLLGFGTTGWTKSVGGERLSTGTFDLRLRYYPAAKSGFFVTGGAGLGSVSFEGDSEHGLGIVIGVGWDIRVAKNASLTVFYDGFAMRNANVDANVGQIGIGVTIH